MKNDFHITSRAPHETHRAHGAIRLYSNNHNSRIVYNVYPNMIEHISEYSSGAIGVSVQNSGNNGLRCTLRMPYECFMYFVSLARKGADIDLTTYCEAHSYGSSGEKKSIKPGSAEYNAICPNGRRIFSAEDIIKAAQKSPKAPIKSLKP